MPGVVAWIIVTSICWPWWHGLLCVWPTTNARPLDRQVRQPARLGCDLIIESRHDDAALLRSIIARFIPRRRVVIVLSSAIPRCWFIAWIETHLNQLRAAACGSIIQRYITVMLDETRPTRHAGTRVFYWHAHHTPRETERCRGFSFHRRRIHPQFQARRHGRFLCTSEYDGEKNIHFQIYGRLYELVSWPLPLSYNCHVKGWLTKQSSWISYACSNFQVMIWRHGTSLNPWTAWCYRRGDNDVIAKYYLCSMLPSPCFR